MKVVLQRYHGLGNDYVVFDPNKNELELTPANVRLICDRNEGLGSDGVLEGPVIREDGMFVKVWNPDGSESETSGNGVRIFAKYLKDASYVQKKHFISTAPWLFAWIPGIIRAIFPLYSSVSAEFWNGPVLLCTPFSIRANTSFFLKTGSSPSSFPYSKLSARS